MSRLSKPFIVLAMTLAVLLPLEQSHCAWMGLQNRAAAGPGPASSEHACCAPAAAGQPVPTKAAGDCSCLQLPLAALSGGTVPAQLLPMAASIATFSPAPAVEPVAVDEAPAPALEVGSPPLPVDPGAHGLRAPPVTA